MTYNALPKVMFFSIYAIILLLYWYIRDKEIFCQIDRIDKTIAVYMGFLILNLLITPDLSRTIWGVPTREEGLLTLFVYILLYYISKKNFRFHKKYFLGVIATLSLVSLHGIIQYYGYDFMPRAHFQENWFRAFSTFGNPNFFASYLVIFLPIIMYSYIYIANKKNSYINFYLPIAGLVYYCLLATLTRSGWVGFFFSSLLLAVMVMRQKKTWKYLLALFFFLVILTIVFDISSHGQVFGRLLRTYQDTVSIVNQTEGFEKAGAHRWFIWMKVIELIKMYPWFGVGIETLDIAFSQYFHDDVVNYLGYYLSFDKAHNEYLHIAVVSGIPSLLVYLGFVGQIISKTILSIEKNHLLIPLLCSIVGYLVQAFFNISTVFAAYVFWILLGAALALSDEK